MHYGNVEYDSVFKVNFTLVLYVLPRLYDGKFNTGTME